MTSITPLEPLPASTKLATLHQRISSEIEGKIVSGEWPVGFRIPFEIELAKHYDVSRMTVNKVLTQLAKAGLIDRVKRSGSFVRRPQAQSAVLEINDIANEVHSLGQHYRFELSRSAKTRGDDGWSALRMDSAAALALEVLHFAGDRPFCLERRLINLMTVPDAETANFKDMSPGQWLINEVPWTSAEHRIEAIAADAGIARALQIARGAPCLVIDRRTWSGVGPVTHVKLAYPGDRHALFARFEPSS